MKNLIIFFLALFSLTSCNMQNRDGIEESKMKKIWIIGASEGIGRELALKLGKDNLVFLSARQKDKLEELANEIGHNARSLPIDAADNDSIQKAYDKIQKEGGIDTLIYAAGIYKPMSAKNFDISMSEKIVDVNLTGAIRTIKHALPDFIKHQEGHIVLIGSVAGYRGLPDSFAYGASKAGLIHLAENLKADLYKDNIKIQVINPGFVKTRLTDMNNFHMPSIIEPDAAADHIIEIMKSDKFESRFPFLFPNFIKSISMLPYSLYFKVTQFLKPEKKAENKMLIFGYGYVASALSEDLHNFEIVATSRSGKKSNKAKIIDFTSEAIEKELKDTTHIISTIAPDNEVGDPVLDHFKEAIKKAPKLKYIGYLSASSVYGNHDGEWVDEESKLNLKSIRGKRRYKAEQAWQNLSDEKKVPLVRFRIAGIYGKNKNVLENLKNGNAKSIYKENHTFNRIHIDDIISSIKSSINQDKESEIYNLADDLPSTQYEVYEFGAKLIGIEAPKRIPYKEADLSPMAQEFYSQNKKISNKKLKKKLGIKLKYPTYKEGLKSLIESII